MAEGQIKRYSDKTEITMGTADTNLAGSDLLLTQHTSGDNSDYGLPMNYIQAMPVGTTATASATATKVVTLSNFPNSYPVVVGTKVLVTFTNANTCTSQLYMTIGTVTAPVTCKGFALKSPIPAGAQIEFTYTGSNWNCQDFAISSLDTSALLPVNSSALNGALVACGSTQLVYGINRSAVVTSNISLDITLKKACKLHVFANGVSYSGGSYVFAYVANKEVPQGNSYFDISTSQTFHIEVQMNFKGGFLVFADYS